MSRRQIAIKPSCVNDLHNFPSERYGALWQKIEALLADPIPDGKLKKKLKGSDDLYRLRVGEHRVFYAFSADWVNLLGIRRRQEKTYKRPPADTHPDPTGLPELPDLDSLASRPQRPAFDVHLPPAPATPLPRALDAAWLQALKVPAAHIPALQGCRTEEALLEAAVPQALLTRVVDALFPPDLQQRQQQPDLVLPSQGGLLDEAGDLVGFLLRLDEEQLKLTRWALKGPTLIRGGAGTGKSTVALYRVREALARSDAQSKLLFTTYTKALLSVSAQLLDQLLTPEQRARVELSTVDQLAHKLVRATRPVGGFESQRAALARLKPLRADFEPPASGAFEAKLRRRALGRHSDRYLLEEFEWIIQGRGLNSVEDYEGADRRGRGVAFSASLRRSVWALYERFERERELESFPALRREALALATQRGAPRYTHVFVDEAQDLSPTALAFVSELAESPEGLFFAADNKQSIYAKGSWAAVHPRLKLRGRTAVLRKNYRSTEQLDRAAFSLLAPEDDSPEPSLSVHQGPRPVLLRGCPPDAQAEWAARFIRQMARAQRLKRSVAAVLVPTQAAGQQLAEELCAAGLKARYMQSQQLDLQEEVVKVMTLHSAKGLEFPIVVVAGFQAGDYPERAQFSEPGLFEERMRDARRLLYVGLSRAMRALMLIVPAGCEHEALSTLDPTLWQLEEPS